MTRAQELRHMRLERCGRDVCDEPEDDDDEPLDDPGDYEPDYDDSPEPAEWWE